MTDNMETTGGITVAPETARGSQRKSSAGTDSATGVGDKKKKSTGKSIANFIFDSKRKTVFGRSLLNWAKLSMFYSIFYFFLGCFFLGLIYVFASLLDRTRPRYYNTESTMAVRSPTAVVGMGFRPQPSIDSSLIEISNDLTEQLRIASSLRLFRDVFLLQGSDARTEVCSDKNPSSDLPVNTACEFDWLKIVPDQSHPCSDNNLYGFKYEQPCVLVKLNKVFGWAPITGHIPKEIQRLRGVYSNKSVANSDVYITCAGTNIADNDVLAEIKYYSVIHPLGSLNYGVIPNYYFPYRNAKDHVQPFVLVQFNKLPENRLVSITCRASAPGIEQSTRGMRGMVSFQLYRKGKYANEPSKIQE